MDVEMTDKQFSGKKHIHKVWESIPYTVFEWRETSSFKPAAEERCEVFDKIIYYQIPDFLEYLIHKEANASMLLVMPRSEVSYPFVCIIWWTPNRLLS